MAGAENSFDHCRLHFWWGGFATILFIGTEIATTQGATKLPGRSADYGARVWQSEERLLHPTVSSIARTPDGFLRLATWNGIGRFDGVQVKVFEQRNTPGLNSSRVVQLQVDRAGGPWVDGQTGELLRIEGGRIQSFTAAEGLPRFGATAAYNQLAPGTYRFQVIACNDSGVWNETGASVRSVVHPFWWQRGWLTPAGIAGLCCLLLLSSHRRIQRLKQDRALQLEFSRRLLESQDHERKRIAGELHDSIGQSLLIIKNRCLLGLKSSEDPEAVSRQLNGISKVSTQAIEEVRHIVHHLSVHLLDQLGLTDAIRVMIDRVVSSTVLRIECKLENVDDLFAPVAATNLYRVIQEAMSNLIRHAHASCARIELIRDLHHVQLTVADDGAGFDPAHPSSGNPKGGSGLGLATMAERVRILGGTLVVESAPGKGTRLQVTIPAKEGPPWPPRMDADGRE